MIVYVWECIGREQSMLDHNTSVFFQDNLASDYVEGQVYLCIFPLVFWKNFFFYSWEGHV